MVLLVLKNFLRSKIATVGLGIILLAGAISLYIGWRYVQKQGAGIAATEHLQQEHIQRNVRFFNKETGLLLYYLRFGLVNETPPLTALSIGQRDVNSSIQNVTIRGLEAQRYDTDLVNPSNLLAGNLDFGFVLIYLFPLLIVAFGYNVLSEEKENGTWRLVTSQSIRPLNVIRQKLALRAGLVFSALALLLTFAAVVLSLPLDSRFFALASLSILYLACWFAIVFWVISLGKNSSISAVMLLSIWLLLTVVLPGAANDFISHRYPMPEAFATDVDQREGYHARWDKDKKATMDGFYAHYPQFRKYPLPDKDFSWLWYYAAQQMGDDDAQQPAKEMYAKLWQREKSSRIISWFIPTLHTQYSLNNLAHSGLHNQLCFLDSTARFHEKLRLHFYPKIFEEAPVTAENWEEFPVERFSEPGELRWLPLLLPLLVLTLLFLAMGLLNFKHKQ